MRRATAFLLVWAKSNKLMNGMYPEEKTETKTGFNSYIITHLIIHFVQVMSSKDLVFPQAVSVLYSQDQLIKFFSESPCRRIQL